MSALGWAALQAEMMCRVTVPNAINGCSSSALDLEGLADPWGHTATVPRHRPNVCAALISFHRKKIIISASCSSLSLSLIAAVTAIELRAERHS